MAPTSILCEELLDIKAEHEWVQGSNRFFIPIDVLRTLITEKTIAAELHHTFPGLAPSQLSSYSLVICDTAKRLFALLLCNNKVTSILEFVDEGITDADL